MTRHYDDWLTAYIEYASFSEAPRSMHFWAGVSAISGALRRKVWIDMGYFKWYPNFYIVFVAPPGIVSKSTTVSISMNILRRVPGINFGPDVITWPALVKAFSECGEQFQLGDEWHTMSAMTVESSEFGNLLNPTDRDMVDLRVTLWDGKQGAFKKVTKTSGSESIENPWINLIACTTPAWIAGNFPEYVIGGGFTSRCIFVYAHEKTKLVAYPMLDIPKGLDDAQLKLAQDLEHIAIKLVGGYQLSSEAITYGTAWYKHHYANKPPLLDDERFGGYLARKQTHIHKLAIILAASQRDDLIITADDLALANKMVSDLETDMPLVFSKIGRSNESIQAERLISFIQKHGEIPFDQAYRFIHAHFPDSKDFEGIISGAVRAGYISMNQKGNELVITACRISNAPNN